MKKKIALIIIAMLLLISIIIPIVKAENEIVNISDLENNIVATVNEDIFQCHEDIDKSNEIINGNVYLLGNNISLLNVTINGDVFICANNVKMDELVKINGNLYICAANVKIDGKISRGLYAVVKDITFEENFEIEYDSNICAERIVVSGSFDRNLNAVVEKFEIKENTTILRNLNYTSNNEANISENVNINNVNFEKYVEEKETVLDVIVKYVIRFMRFFIVTMILFIIIMKFFPRFLEKSNKIFNVSSFGIGILAIILIPILIVCLLFINFTTLLAVILSLILVLVLLMANGIAVIAFSSYVASKTKKIKLPLLVPLNIVLAWILFKIPFIGGMIFFIMMATGLGMVIRYQFIKEK